MAFVGNRYRLHEKLGEGAMGAVYRATDRLTGSIVALKRVTISQKRLDFASRATVGSISDLPLALAREFRLLASVRHPNIIRVLDYGFDLQRQPYFTMDLVANARTIEQAGKGRPESVQVALLLQLLQALAYLHRRGILHRDLKPANVLVTPEQRIKVLDFGLSVAADQATSLAGTLPYMPPEVLRGEPVGRASDLYSVGVIAYEMVVGHHPFDIQNPTRLITSILQGAPDMSAIANPRLASVLLRLLNVIPDARYADADQAILALSDAVGRPLPPETSAIRDSFLQAAPFIGREDELAWLSDALTEAAQGQGSAWLIGGESGVGKSRLAAELSSLAMVGGALVLTGQAVEGGGLPYQLWRRPLRRLALSTDLSDLEAGILKEIVPDIATLLERAIPDAPGLAASARQQRLKLTLVDVLRRQAARQPVVLILEDLQWAGESLELLKPLVRMVHQRSLVIIATYRDDECPNLPADLPEMTVVSLPRLKRKDIAALSAAMLGAGGRQPGLVDFLQQQTEGNVFFLVEVVRALAEEVPQLGDVAAMTLPASVMAGGITQIVQRRLNRVAAGDMALLKLAAVAGRELDLAVLRALAPDADLDAWLTATTNAAVLDVRGARAFFAHDRLREALLAQLEAGERAALHRQVASAIESAHAGEAAFFGVLAEHWQIAGDMPKTIRYACLAGEQAYRLGDYPEVLRLGSLAMECLAFVGDDPEASLRASALALLGKAYIGVSQFAQARLCFQESLEAARALNDRVGEMEALHGLGEAAYRQGEFTTALAHFAKSLALARETGSQRSLVASLNRMGVVTRHQGQGRHAAARVYLEESLEVALAIGDRYGVATNLNSLGVLSMYEGNYAQARQHYEDSLAIRRAIGDREGIAMSLLNLGDVNVNVGDFPTAQRYLQESLERYREIGDLDGASDCLNCLGRAAVDRGQYAEARSSYEESLAIRRQINDRVGVGTCLTGLGKTATRQGNFALAQACLDEALALFREIDHQYGVAISLLLAGELARCRRDDAAALACLENSLALYRQLNDRPGIAAALLVLGDMAYDQSRLADARAHYETSLALFREIKAPPTIVEALYRLGFVCADLGDDAAARSALHEALSLAYRADITPAVLQALLGFARLALWAGDFERAATLVGLAAARAGNDDYPVQMRLQRLQGELAAILPADSLRAFIARGTRMKLDAVVGEMKVQPEMDAKDTNQLKQALEDAVRRLAQLEALEAELAQTRAALENAKARYHSLFEGAGDSIFIIDPQTLRILDGNTHAARRLGYTTEELLLLSLPDVEILNADDESSRAWQSSASSTSFYECVYRRKDGTDIPCEVSSRLVRHGDQVILYNFVRDISARKRAEAHELDLKLERERIHILERFIGDASHDLKTPLTTMKTSLAVLVHPDVTAEMRQRHLQLLGVQVTRLERLLEDLLNMSRLDHIDSLDRQPTDLNTLVQVVVEEYRLQAEQKQHTVEVLLAPEAPVVLVDAPMLHRAIAALLSNALGYTPNGGTIRVETRTQGQETAVCVQDNGIGIGPADLPHIFERFYRADPARSAEIGGLGLGLAIAQRIVDAHGGRIDVTSVLGEGSTFCIVLPPGQ